jgi:hypothetical protein
MPQSVKDWSATQQGLKVRLSLVKVVANPLSRRAFRDIDIKNGLFTGKTAQAAELRIV